MILENLLILFVLLPCMLLTWWFMVTYVNKRMGFSLKDIYEKIYSDPIASAILRVGTMLVIAIIVIAAYGRIV